MQLAFFCTVPSGRIMGDVDDHGLRHITTCLTQVCTMVFCAIRSHARYAEAMEPSSAITMHGIGVGNTSAEHALEPGNNTWGRSLLAFALCLLPCTPPQDIELGRGNSADMWRWSGSTAQVDLA